MPVGVTIKTRRGASAEWVAAGDPVLDSGEPGLETDTGAIKYGDGTSKFSELVNVRKQFQNVVTVAKTGKKGYADFICSDSQWSGSDAECIQAAITNSADELWFMPGSYTMSANLSFIHKNIKIRGIGEVIINFNLTGAGLHFEGSPLMTTTLGSDSTAGSTSLTLSSTTDIKAGDLLVINNSSDWTATYPNFKTGEMYEIKSVSGATVVINDPLVRSYTSGDSISVFSPITVSFENIHFIGAGATTNQTAISIRYGKHIKFHDCAFKNNGLSSIMLYTCYDVDISNNSIDNSERAGYGYGVAITTASTKIRVENNKINACRHCVTCGSDFTVNGQNRDILVTGNELYSSVPEESAVDSHPCTLNYKVDNNIIHTLKTAFADGALYSTFSNNEVYGGNGVNLRDGTNYYATKIITGNIIHNGVLYYDIQPQHFDNVIIANNTVSGGTIQVCINHPTTKTIKSLSISNNSFDGASQRGVYIVLPSLLNPLSLDIHHNHILNCGYEGICVDLITTYLNAVDISHNSILCHNTTGSTYAGIKLYRVVNGIISKNKIIDKNNNTGWSIREDTGCNYNQIINNVTKGGTGGVIYKVGANTKIKNNSDYITENTGTTIIPASATSIVVSHGLAVAPTNVIVTPRRNVGSIWSDTFTTTQFTIHCSTAPTSDTVVGWSAVV